MYRAKMVQWFDVIGHSTGFKKRWTLKALKAQAADAHTSTSVPHKSVKCIVLKYSCSIFSFLLFLVNFIISFSFFFFIHPRFFPSFRIFYSCTRTVSIFNVYFICSLPLLPPPPPFLSLDFFIVKSSKNMSYVFLFLFSPFALRFSPPFLSNNYTPMIFHSLFIFLFFSFANNKTNYYRHACTHRKSSLVQVAYA